ncbi:MAG TPA: proline--tRNA ligase [Anaerolineales bacterium]|nr:proline--tRNA ligase [Anaerolineales bacterium]
MSRLFNQTLREAPADAEVSSHKLLVRAGYIQQLAAGIFTYLPLAKRVLTKIENIMRQEIEAIGGQEITLPVVHPAELWKETGRWYQIGSEMGRFYDKSGRDMVLAMTHEEVVADLVRKSIRSYRQLPALIYHIQTKWRDDPRPRAGLIRVREFTMKDSYSLDLDQDGLDTQYRAHFQAYYDIFHRCGLPVKAFKSDVGMMGGSLAHEFMYLTPIGEDTLLICDECGYAANRQIARFKKDSDKSESPQALQKVATPDSKTIEDLANFLNIPRSRTAKAVFLVATIVQGIEASDRLVLAIVRGDMDLNETKLANVLMAKELRPALEEEIVSTGAVPGYASPKDLKNTLVVVDDVIPDSPNLVAGANEEGFHFINVNYGRDFQAEIIADIAVAEDNSMCPECGHQMTVQRGVEVGNIFKLGTRYSEAMGAKFLDSEGNSKPVVMGSYGIGSGRLMASVAEEHHDEYGLIWPISVAPYSVLLIVLPRNVKKQEIDDQGDPDPLTIAEQLYMQFQSSGIEILFDDRQERPGVKFNDADLIGIPIRLTVSDRALQAGGIEVKRRDQKDKNFIPVREIINHVNAMIADLQADLDESVVTIPFED